MATHLAILLKPYVEMILDGRKTMESRLTRTPLPPYRMIEPGDRIFIKISSGPIAATALADKVRFYNDMTPRDVQTLRKRHDQDICGNDEYWAMKRDSRYATLVRLRDVQATSEGPRVHSTGRAWFVVDERTWPAPRQGKATCIDIDLTEAACRNRYVRPPRESFAEAGPFTLLLPDGQKVQTDLYRGMIRWRGWGPYFAAQGVAAGGRVQLEPVAPHTYRVHLTPRSSPP
jgi:hypothetical protein